MKFKKLFAGLLLRKRESSKLVVLCSRQIDSSPANAVRDPEARTWGRIAKVAEEAGEVIAAYIGVTDQNPRKGITHSMDDVAEELLDVALIALAAYEHITDHQGTCISQLNRHTLPNAVGECGRPRNRILGIH